MNYQIRAVLKQQTRNKTSFVVGDADRVMSCFTVRILQFPILPRGSRFVSLPCSFLPHAAFWYLSHKEHFHKDCKVLIPTVIEICIEGFGIVLKNLRRKYVKRGEKEVIKIKIIILKRRNGNRVGKKKGKWGIRRTTKEKRKPSKENWKCVG
jgi:hypothetical protein